MSIRPEYLRLYRLIDDLAFDFLSEEVEKDLLIALSQVFRKVKQLSNEFDTDEELLSEPVYGCEVSIDSTARLDNRFSLVKITGNLMFLLVVNSRYVQHLAGNTIVAISEFLVKTDEDWNT